MKRLFSLVLLGAILGAAGPASAMRGREHIDADQRATITLAAERAQTINIAPEVAPSTDPTQLPTPEQRVKAEAAPPVVSSVPEPSGLVLLACGLMLLLLTPGSDNAAITPERTPLRNRNS